MIVVTGAAGFIGSNVVHALCARGRRDVVAVDELTDGTRFTNLVGADIADYLDKDEFLARIRRRDPSLNGLEAILHQGACSATTEWNGRFMMENNYEYTKVLAEYCLERGVQLVAASSAAVYGGSTVFREEPACEGPLNVYGWSKLVFDNWLRRRFDEGKRGIVALRYFNVYGPREQHKGSMASVAFHQNRQVLDTGRVKLFQGTDGYGNGEQRRDFVHVDDVAAVNLWFLDHKDAWGIFNVGTGRAQPFNDVARAVIKAHGRGEIEYIPFPDHLKGRYQSFTEADLTRLRAAGCDVTFRTVEQGVAEYMAWLGQGRAPMTLRASA